MSNSTDAVIFTFDGRSITARPGQTIAGALHEAGVHVLSRSFKYHRPRGLFCATGRCPNCLCTVDGDPNAQDFKLDGLRLPRDRFETRRSLLDQVDNLGRLATATGGRLAVLACHADGAIWLGPYR